MSEETIKLKYSSPRNITSSREIPVSISREDWAEMSADDQAETITDALSEIVEIGVVGK